MTPGKVSLSLIVALLVLGGGCAHVPLMRNSQRQAKTVSQIQQQQVMDNIAMFASDSHSIPFFSIADAGSTQVSLNTGGDGALSWSSSAFTGSRLGFGGQGTLTENWTLKPVNDPLRLSMMRCVFQKIVCKSSSDCLDCDAGLRILFGDDYPWCATPACWFKRGCKKDIPSNACFKAKYGEMWVWVEPSHREQLALVTIAILRIATADLSEFANPEDEVEIEETLQFSNGRIVKAKFAIERQEYERFRDQSTVATVSDSTVRDSDTAPQETGYAKMIEKAIEQVAKSSMLKQEPDANQDRTSETRIRDLIEDHQRFQILRGMIEEQKPSLPAVPLEDLDLGKAGAPGSLRRSQSIPDYPISAIRSLSTLPQD